MKRTVVALAAAAVLVGAVAAGAAVAAPAPSDAVGEDEHGAVDGPARRHPVREVLDGLVADGTLTEAQSDAVIAALREAYADRRPVRDAAVRDAARRGARAGVRLGTLIADGVIDADELASLPDGHLLRDPDGPAEPYLGDGVLTVEELRMIRAGLRDRAPVDG